MANARLPEPAPPHRRPSRFSHLVLPTPRDPKAAGVVHFPYTVETLGDLVNAYLSRRPVEQVAFADRFGEALFDPEEEDSR